MRILVTGSRTWQDVDTIRNVLGGYLRDYPGSVVVSGACPNGADAIAEFIAEEHGAEVERHPAEWDLYGKRAGFVRNGQMVNLGADLCLAFIKNNSKGATMTADMAEQEGIQTKRFYINAEF